MVKVFGKTLVLEIFFLEDSCNLGMGLGRRGV